MLNTGLTICICVVIISTVCTSTKVQQHTGRNVDRKDSKSGATNTLTEYLRRIQVRDARPNCTPHCARWSCSVSDNRCVSCLEGYDLRKDGTCSACSPNCKSCSGDICRVCEDHYGLNAEGKCEACPQHCLQCYTSSEGEQRCSECIPRHALVDFQCSQPCPSNCEYCETEPHCVLSCEAGYEKSPEGQCIHCPNGQCGCPGSDCDMCMDGWCQFCFPNYGPNAERRCIACPDNCEYCLGENCVLCSSGYALVDHRCKEVCPPHCVNCGTDPSTCVWKCAEGYGRSLDGQCKPCPTNCQQCLWSDTCRICDIGYGLELQDSGIELCIPCSQERCVVCESATYCLRCEDGYGIKSWGICEALLDHDPVVKTIMK